MEVTGNRIGESLTEAQKIRAREALGNEAERNAILDALKAFPEAEAAVRFVDPVNKRFGPEERGKKPGAYIEEKIHKPAELVNELAFGAGCSWDPFSEYLPEIQKEWEKFGVEVVALVQQGGEDMKAKIEALTAEKREEAELQLKLQMQELAKNPKLPEPLRRCLNPDSGRNYLADSGSEAVLFMVSLFKDLKIGKGIGLTDRNGSDVEKRAKDLAAGEFVAKTIELTNVDGTMKDTAKLVDEYLELIDKEGVQLIVVPLVPKTGEKYAGLNRQMAIEVAARNKVRDENKKIFMVVDAVQAMGRVPMEEIAEYLDMNGVGAVLVTESKGPGGVAHAGQMLFAEGGNEIWQKMVEGNNKVVDKLARENKVDGGILGKGDRLPYATLLRQVANMRALEDYLKLSPEYRLDGSFAKAVGKMMEEKLIECGFREIPPTGGHEKVPSIRALKLPEGMDVADARRMLVKAAEGGIMFGGLMERKKDSIFRYGVPVEFMKFCQGLRNEQRLSPEAALVMARNIFDGKLKAVIEGAIQAGRPAEVQ